MPLDYLRSLAHQILPLHVEDLHGLQCVAVLQAANLVEADIRDGDAPGQARSAVVNRITAEGRAVLVRDAGNKPIA